jgi:predicted RNA-binding Zn-ribbon protein involved in translation (DUF1610 family)
VKNEGQGLFGFGIFDGTLLSATWKPPAETNSPWKCPNCGKQTVYLITLPSKKGGMYIFYKQYGCGYCGWSYPHIPGQNEDKIKLELREKYDIFGMGAGHMPYQT